MEIPFIQSVVNPNKLVIPALKNLSYAITRKISGSGKNHFF